MSDIKITDNTKIFLSAFDRAIENGLEAIGMTAETYAKKEISRPKAHADGTVRPNVDTGRLRNSITHAIDAGEKAVYIGTNVEYAPYVELGTSRSPAYPYLRPAATEHGPEYKRIMEAALKSAK